MPYRIEPVPDPRFEGYSRGGYRFLMGQSVILPDAAVTDELREDPWLLVERLPEPPGPPHREGAEGGGETIPEGAPAGTPASTANPPEPPAPEQSGTESGTAPGAVDGGAPGQK